MHVGIIKNIKCTISSAVEKDGTAALLSSWKNQMVKSVRILELLYSPPPSLPATGGDGC